MMLETTKKTNFPMPNRLLCSLVVLLCTTFLSSALAADFSQADAAASLKRAVTFFRSHVGVHGGYGFTISHDLRQREGENRTSNTQAWVEPPATPAVGLAYLNAYQLTGEQYLLEAARETAACLVATQLISGGWKNPIEMDSTEKFAHPYRKNPTAAAKVKVKRELTTLDDNKTQSCLTFLMRLDVETKFQNADIHEAVKFGLDSIVNVQYPNGAWPQQYESPPDASKFPVKKASYPDSWSRTYPAKNYTEYYTFNDDTIADVVILMLEASTAYSDARYLNSAKKAGDFIVAAQLPEPQPGWAQQYDAEMHPVWARKFEPPSLSGLESQSLLKILMLLYRHTGDRKYLEPIAPALAWLQRSKLSDGQMARFYELKTNRPLYFTKRYELTYEDSDLPTHYGFKVGGSGIEKLQSEYQELAQAKSTEKPSLKRLKPEKLTSDIARTAEKVSKQLDERGAWVEEGRMKDYGDHDTTRQIITCKTFIKNIRDLARYASAK
jgi:PelA/Pel-15E family pectate lyase